MDEKERKKRKLKSEGGNGTITALDVQLDFPALMGMKKKRVQDLQERALYANYMDGTARMLIHTKDGDVYYKQRTIPGE